MAAIVHHGGAGTTGAALASGRPQVVCPFVADQPFYARHLHASGVAAAPQPQHRLTPDGLAHAVRLAVTSRAMASHAEEFGHRIRAENGVTTAVRILESLP
ncbi:glycosyltransferase [Amycolatopsis anabasis]|uniref:glycosyltransferase n=1 Tax=Amycolatopsis anabasis TaxID=1840409 RepID=UPI001FE658DC|nr:nucleotide disphospho-sugar-binding domain-containing protein [Amycolatopsis anabasis]